MKGEAVARLARLPVRGARAMIFLAREPRPALEAFALEHVLHRPIVYHDRDDLRYILRPGENGAAYLRARGNYETAETAFCRRYLKSGMIAFDVGAHIGLYTLLFGRLVGAGGMVHAFEPDGDNAQRLRVNVLLNELGNVHVVEAAVTASTGEATLHRFATGLSAWHSLGRPRMADPENPRNMIEPCAEATVATISLDDYCTAAGISRIDLLKIDVEGAEVDVVRGATGLLRKDAVSTVQFEVSAPQVEALGHRPTDIFALLDDFGFNCYVLDPEGYRADRVTQPTARYGNYVAALRS